MTEENAKVSVTEEASKRIAKLLVDQDSIALRLSIKGGGCSGFSYGFVMENNITLDDFKFRDSDNGAVLVIDPISMMYLDGAVLDMESSIEGEHFSINNPQAKSSCGCGSSFSI